MAFILENLDVYVRRDFDKRFNSSFIQRNALLYFLGLRNAEGQGKLGQPKTAGMLGGASLGEAELMEPVGGKSRFFRYQTDEPDDGGTIPYGGSTHTATKNATEFAGATEFRFCEVDEPYKIYKKDLQFCKGDLAIGQLMDETTAVVWNRFLKRMQTLLWFGGTAANGSAQNMNTAAQQAENMWLEPLSVVYAIGTEDNILGRVSRSTETTLNPFVIDASSDLATSLVSLDHNRYVNNGFTKQDGTAFVGRSRINPNGVGCQLHVTTNHIFNELATQADARGINTISGGLPEHSVTGFKYPIIEHDNVFYTYDDDCPSGSMYHFDLDSILMETMPGENFEFQKLVDKSKTEEGGAEYLWSRYIATIRLGWRCPWLMGVTTNLTTP